MVGYRDDEGGRDALNLAVSMAQAFGVSLDLVSVVPGGRRVSRSDRGVTRRAREALDRGAALVPRDVPVRVHVRTAPAVAPAVLQTARDLGSRVIILGSDGPGGFGARLRRQALGSVTTDVLQEATIPVALAPLDYRVNRPIESVDCAVGTRPGGQAVLDVALRVCVRTGLPLRVVILVDPDTEINDAIVDEARARVALLMSSSVARYGAPTDTRFVFARGGDVPAVIEATKWLETSVLIVGSTRVGAPQRQFLGAAVSKILDKLPSPVIVVPNMPVTEGLDLDG
nr:universal stress protein [Kineosphaera limosa]